jgi:extradiol dioxygenase family protein
MDYLDLKAWLELWKEELDNLHAKKGEFKKIEKERELLLEVSRVIEEKRKNQNWDFYTSQGIAHLNYQELTKIEEKFNKINEQIQSKKVEIIYIEEKLKIIEEKLKNAGIDVYQQMIENLMKTII